MALPSTVPQSNFLATFTCFKDLPAELRVQIWKHASFHTRDVDIRIGSPKIMWPGRSKDLFCFHSSCLPPAVLHVDTEARHEALKWYEVSFGTSHKTPHFGFSTPPTIYFNWKADRLCFVDYNHYLRINRTLPNWWPRIFGSYESLRYLYAICNRKRLRVMAWNVSQMKPSMLPRNLFNPMPRGCQIQEFILFKDAAVQFPTSHRGDALLVPAPAEIPRTSPLYLTEAWHAQWLHLKKQEEYRNEIQDYWLK